MRIGEVIGTVTMSRLHGALTGGRFVIAVPYSLEALRAGGPADGEEVIVYDELGAGSGSRIGISEGREAAMPFHPGKKPLDAYCACILDQVAIEA